MYQIFKYRKQNKSRYIYQKSHSDYTQMKNDKNCNYYSPNAKYIYI